MKKSSPILAALTVIALLFATACSAGVSAPDAGARAPAAPQNLPDSARHEYPGGEARSLDQEPAPNSAEERAEEHSAEEPSTFALDVDTASYGYARRAIQEGRRPEPGQVRTEEFVNAFRQDYAEPEGDGFAVHLDGARMPEKGTALLRVGLQTREPDASVRRPVSLTFVVDVSGSMAEAGRLDLVRRALHTLVDQLVPGDQVSIVSFREEAQVVAEMTAVTYRAELHEAIDMLGAGGSTNLSDGLDTGYRLAAGAFRQDATNRVILLSDGLANTGETTWQAILDRVSEHAGKKITLLCVGVGREYGDQLMEQLADRGDGAAVYVSTEDEVRKAFTERLTTTLEVRARDAKAQVSFNPSAVESYALLGYEDRALTSEDFRDDSKDGGEIGPGHSVTALYRVRLRPDADGRLATATVRWLDPDTRRPSEADRSVDVFALAPALWGSASVRLQVDAVAADFAEHLRGRWSGKGGTWSLAELIDQADRLAARTEDPAVSELATLLRRARDLG
ncbi:von Willebrand factor type A domain-containing protein [Microbispora sp. NEAU-D428]|uniref:vWA domain-containing protein n=1 Tax=Microbispora sitophila TaxID=2771537 RepID=UPI0018687DD5|nr:von Willebrand factor type A domain-containing protein [Microbispora sitophila]MBE3016143.1 von Willebrand factor type A domain-containing protein [Microbispora sitophila]